jgi:15-cis-phytoene synthase
MSAAVQPAPSGFSPTASQLAVAYSVCRSITRKAAKNFYYAFLVLPKAKRQALCAVYAFMRKCDDIADDPGMSVRERRQKLNEWLEGMHRSFAGQATDDPVLLALTDAQRKYKIPVEQLDELAQGTAMDVQESGPGDDSQSSQGDLVIQYRTFDDLYLYCYRVASVVGLICIRVFGYNDPQAEPLAEQCGVAFQLTNIIRDVKEDASLGRVYVPEEDLQRFSVSAHDLQSASDAAPFRELLAFESARAREYYQSADALIPLIDEDSQPALWVLVTIYRRLLNEIALRQYDVFSGRVSLSVREKLTILGKGFVKRLT